MDILATCKGMYITCVRHNDESEGYPVNSYRTKEEALAHIQYQREFGNKNNYWTILHIKDMEWINPDK